MRSSARFALLALAWVGLAAGASAQDTDVHEISWYVHVDMLTAGEPLSFWQAFIEEATAISEIHLKGNQGSDLFFDAVCCTELAVQTVGTYGSPGDGLDTPEFGDVGSMRSSIAGGDPGGSVSFLVREIALCNGSMSAIGCAGTPPCDSNANDDPDLSMLLSVEAMQDDDANFVPEGVGGMGQTLAHERGHNACLGHLSDDNCQLMASGGDGGCISASECTDIREARTTTTQGDACDCHAGTAPVSDGGACTESTGAGLCSGGVCSAGLAWGGSVELFAGGAPGEVEDNGTAPLDAVTDDLLRVSDVPGGWVDAGDFAAAIQGLAYDPDRNVVWGVLDNGSEDQIVQIDPATGAVTSTLATLTGHPNVIALAFHPGDTPAGSDDHLLANSAEPEASCDFGTGSCSGDLIEIDPATGAFQVVGDMSAAFTAGLRGMAYDSGNGILYGSAWTDGRLWEFSNLTCNATECSCPSSFCTLAGQTAVDVNRIISGLAYSPVAGRLYIAGSQTGGRQFFNVIDPDTFESTADITVTGYTTGGLAAVTLPEPSLRAAWLAAALALGGLAARRGDRSNARRGGRGRR